MDFYYCPYELRTIRIILQFFLKKLNDINILTANGVLSRIQTE